MTNLYDFINLKIRKITSLRHRAKHERDEASDLKEKDR